MKDESPVRLFLRVRRNFGLATALRVAWFRGRGKLFPALALPDPSLYPAAPRAVSVMLDAGAHGPAVVDAIVDLLADRQRLDWEVCVCARSPVGAGIAPALARRRGAQPWIRIVAAPDTVDAATAARWTIEQATGRCVAFVGAAQAPPRLDEFSAMLTFLRDRSDLDAAALPAGPPPAGAGARAGRCRLLLAKKSAYLTAADGTWPLTADDAADLLLGRARTVFVSDGDAMRAADLAATSGRGGSAA